MNKISIKQLKKRLSIKFLKENPRLNITSHGVVIFQLVAMGTRSAAMDTRLVPMDTRLVPMGTRLSGSEKPMDTRSENKPVKKPINKLFKTYFKTKNNPAGL